MLEVLDCFGYFAHEEGLTFDFIALGIAELRELGPQVIHELTAVELAHEDFGKAGENFLSAFRKRIYPIEMSK